MSKTAMSLLSVILLFGLFNISYPIFAGSPAIFYQETGRIPCSDLDFFSDAKYFRATGIGTHPNPRVAERMARLEANAQLSAGISVSIQSVTSRYMTEHRNGSTTEYIDAFEQLSRQTTERHLRNIKIVCNHLEAGNGQYTVYLAVEVAAEDVLFDLEEEFQKDPSLQHLYDKSMLKELFDEELGVADADENIEDP